LNSNRNNNRRRGRGNNRGGNSGGNGGGLQGNRIDSRARGNAPQMLEKYKKLANDAALNDDRVQTEYYLQFADHYFRIIADTKAQKDESRARREAETGQSEDYDDDEDEDNRPRSGHGRDQRDNDPRDNDQSDSDPRDNEARDNRQREGAEGDDDAGDNPFTPEKPARKPRKAVRKPATRKSREDSDSLSADVLPPAIARASSDDGKEAKPARRARSRPRSDEDGEPLEAVG